MASKAKLGGMNHRLTPMASAVVLAMWGSGIVAPAAAQTAPEPKAATEQTTATPKPVVLAQAAAAPPPVVVAQAAAAPSPAAPAAEQAPKLESIVVTANRRIEKLEKVPQSITVIGAEDIERNNVREFQDLVDLAPALTISTGTQVGTNSINLRGIGTFSNNLGIEGDVAIILDDVPFAIPQQAFKDLHDVARIEVLKGPQSTLFGKSAIAGAIVVTTAPIGSGPLRGKVSTYLTDDREYRVSGMVSGRITDKVGIRFAASKSDFKGLLHNLTTGDYVNGSGGSNFNGKVEWNLADNLDVSLSGFYSDSVTEGNTSALIALDSRLGFLARVPGTNAGIAATSSSVVYAGITPSLKNRDVRLDSETSLAQEDVGAALRVNYTFPSGSFLANHTLTSITGFNNNKANDRRDNDSHDVAISQYLQPVNSVTGALVTPVPAFPNPVFAGQKWEINGTTETTTLTQDFRLTSPDSGTFKYLVGLWFSSTELERTYLRGLIGIKQSNYTDYWTTSKAQNLALYANSTWEFMPNHTLTVGGRVNQEDNDYSYWNRLSLSSAAAANTPYSSAPNFVAPGNSEGAFTGKLAYAYNIDADRMVYASYATGRKGVAYDMTSGADNQAVRERGPLPAETAQGLELGFKANLLNGRATFAASAFQTEFEDFQASVTQTVNGGNVSLLYGIPRVRTRGVEFETKMLVSSALTVSATYAYTEASIRDWPFATCYSQTLSVQPECTKTGNPLVTVGTTRYVDGKGFRMPNAPTHKGTIGAEYKGRLGPFKASYFGQVRSQSDVKGSINQDPAQDRFGITIVNAGMSLATGAFKLSLGVNNLFDKQYATGGQGNIVTLVLPNTTSTTSIVNQGWKPARDAFRYYTARLDVTF